MIKKIIVFVFFACCSVVFGQSYKSGREAYKATREIKNALKHTKLSVSFDIAKETMYGEEWLVASPYFYAQDSLILDAQKMIIEEVAMKNKGGKKLNFSYKDDVLRIKLDRQYKQGENFEVYIKYVAQPWMISDPEEKGLYFVNPKGDRNNVSQQIWTQGESVYASCWFPTIDATNQKTTQEIYMRVPDRFVTLSNGVLKDSKKEGSERTDHWVMDKPHAPYLFFMGAGEFSVVKDTPWRGKVPINYYVEKKDEAVAKKIFGYTGEMIEFFSNLLDYPYPWQKYDQMVVREFVSGAMENTTAVSFGDFAIQDENTLNDFNGVEDTVAHELLHHWFGDLVTCESYSNISLNESFANYSEYWWFEHKYGKDFADYHMEENLESYYLDNKSANKTLVRYDYGKTIELFDLLSYNKGGGILHMLRGYLGDEAFFKSLNYYLKKFEYGTAEIADLRMSFEKVSGKDLNWFFKQWYFGNGHPVVTYSKAFSKKNNTLIISVTQNQTNVDAFEYPLEIDIYKDKTPERRVVWVNADRHFSTMIQLDYEPKLVVIDPRGLIVSEKTEEGKSRDEYLHQIKYAKDYASRAEALSYGEKLKDSEILLAGLKDGFFSIRIRALKGLEKIGYQKYLPEIERVAKEDKDNRSKAEAVRILGRTGNTKYKDIFEKGIETKSAAMKSASLPALLKMNPEVAVKHLDDVSIRELGEEELVALFPYLLKYDVKSKAKDVIYPAVLYPMMRDIDTKELFKKVFDWALRSDRKECERTLRQVRKEMKDYDAINYARAIKLINETIGE